MNYKKVLAIFIVFMLLFYLSKWDERQGRNSDRIIDAKELTEIQGVLSITPSIENSKSGSSMLIKLNEFPNFKFTVSTFYFRALSAVKFIDNISKGDTLSIKVLTYDYETKIKSIKKPRITERIFNYELITPYSITGKGIIFMTLNDMNKEWELNHSMGIFLMYYISGIIALLGIIYFVFYFTGITKKIETWWREFHLNH